MKIVKADHLPTAFHWLQRLIQDSNCRRRKIQFAIKNGWTLACLGLVFFLPGCEDDSGYTPDYQKVVIQGYLYAGDTIDDIRLTNTLPMGDESGIQPPIIDATVTLIKNGFSYLLTPSETDSGYYEYKEHDLAVEEGDEFTIKVEYFGEETTGSTTVPPPPVGVSLASDTLMVPVDFDPRTFEYDSTKHQIRVSWETEEDAMYFIKIENMEEDPEQVSMQIPPRGMPGRMVAMPLNQSTYVILFEDIRYYGRHKVTVYRVNKEYVDLYISRNQNSRELNEPLTNIINGLGVFSAFNSVEYYFDAIAD